MLSVILASIAAWSILGLGALLGFIAVTGDRDWTPGQVLLMAACGPLALLATAGALITEAHNDRRQSAA
jgi:hypothetical protein